MAHTLLPACLRPPAPRGLEGCAGGCTLNAIEDRARYREYLETGVYISTKLEHMTAGAFMRSC